MARRTGASARTLALTKAQEAVAQRDAERIQREKQLEAALADFYQAQGEVERIHKGADLAAAPFEATIRESVRSLDRLGETRAGIAGLTGLSLPQVRDCLSDEASNAPAPDAPFADELARRRRQPDIEAFEGAVPAAMPAVRAGD
ncbi:hypothetical protein [Catenulispora pinisilvae]|uniref:hypothetical protein n=1 Tax=Catenulispora pinisilvae TaxID=2705253 RepID=UPI00189181CE|nr:hypothetical protein [Catenulispora pinisilvae]